MSKSVILTPAHIERLKCGALADREVPGPFPDRTPVKMTIRLLPELAEALGAYAAAYEQAYGKAEPVTGDR